MTARLLWQRATVTAHTPSPQVCTPGSVHARVEGATAAIPDIEGRSAVIVGARMGVRTCGEALRP